MHKPKLNTTYGFKCDVCGYRTNLKPSFECMGCADQSTHIAIGLDLSQIQIIERLVGTGKISKSCKSYQAAIDYLLKQLDKSPKTVCNGRK